VSAESKVESEPRAARPVNRLAASMLRECGELLRQQDANPFRVNAYLAAAGTLEGLEQDAREILDRRGLEGLMELPGIGRGLASAIEEIARTGRLTRLDRLRGSETPEAVLGSIPGLGPRLSRLIHERLGIDTLESLELAAHDGRLARVPGIGPRRLEAIRAGIARLLGRKPAYRREPDGAPGIDVVLDVDAQYRREAPRLPKLAPKRFNPEGAAWLPVLHTQRAGWHFTALFSNTARAHELGKTQDWVVLYFYNDDHHEAQHTVVTETRGELAGRRVVRGRERECAAYYAGARSASNH